jgi:pimeloyl-ACP methyl ester carboxylesterase
MQMTLRSQTGLEFTGVLQQEQSKTLVIICYGYKSTPKHPSIKIVSDDLNQNGYATFVFHFSSDSLAMDIKGQVQDIESIVAHFDGQFDNIVLLASSLGALSASIASARTPRINFLITVNGFFGLSALSRSLKRDFVAFRLAALWPGKYREIWRFYKQQFLPRNIKAHTLVLHCPTDQEVFMAQSNYFYNALIGEKTFGRLSLADHDISQAKDAHTIVNAVVSWLDQQIDSRKSTR